MKRMLVSGMVLALLAGVAAGREFTGKNGKTIEAEIVSKTEQAVVLELESGKTVTVPLSSLSEADQLYVQVWESPGEKEAKESKLRDVDLDAVLAAKGYVAFPIESRGQFSVVKLRLGDKEAAFMFNHSVEEPVLDQAAAERLGLKIDPLEGGAGGGSVVGTVTAERFSNGTEGIDGARILVAPINGVPDEVDGVIGGQFFIDRAARLDFAMKKLWLRNR